jgi:hypothetical protein
MTRQKRTAEQIVEDGPKEKVIVPLRKYEIQKLYLEIQRNLGTFGDHAPKELKNDIRDMGVTLLRLKRKWIGVFEELDV